MKESLLILFLSLICWNPLCASSPDVYDIDMAKDILDERDLDNVEGIWFYPEDKVTVLVLKDDDNKKSVLQDYSITVLETTDARLHPGDKIGILKPSADSHVFDIELFTEKKNDLLLQPKTCTATLGKDGDSFIFKKGKNKIRGRLNLNFTRLLPGFWKIVSLGLSGNQDNNIAAPVGMVKIYPSYDGNGSSRRSVRYL